MATKHAEFKTAYLQREVPVNACVAETGLDVKAMVILTVADTGKVITGTTDVTKATHIVAQSDVTMNGNHIPTDLGDYRYDPRLIPMDAKLKGYEADTTELAKRTQTNAAVGDRAVVLADGKVYECSAVTASASTWAAASPAETIADVTKKVALYPIYDVNDVIVVD